MTLAWGATMTLAAGETSWGCKTFPEDGGAAAGAAAGAEGAGAGGGEGAEGIFCEAISDTVPGMATKREVDLRAVMSGRAECECVVSNSCVCFLQAHWLSCLEQPTQIQAQHLLESPSRERKYFFVSKGFRTNER